jgi:hypothetical protein
VASRWQAQHALAAGEKHAAAVLRASFAGDGQVTALKRLCDGYVTAL